MLRGRARIAEQETTSVRRSAETGARTTGARPQYNSQVHDAPVKFQAALGNTSESVVTQTLIFRQGTVLQGLSLRTVTSLYTPRTRGHTTGFPAVGAARDAGSTNVYCSFVDQMLFDGIGLNDLDFHLNTGDNLIFYINNNKIHFKSCSIITSGAKSNKTGIPCL